MEYIRGIKGSQHPSMLLSPLSWRITFPFLCVCVLWYSVLNFLNWIEILKRKQYKHEGIRLATFMWSDSTEPQQSWTKTEADAFSHHALGFLCEITFYGNSLNCSIASSLNCTLQDVRLSIACTRRAISHKMIAFFAEKIPQAAKIPPSFAKFCYQF